MKYEINILGKEQKIGDRPKSYEDTNDLDEVASIMERPFVDMGDWCIVSNERTAEIVLVLQKIEVIVPDTMEKKVRIVELKGPPGEDNDLEDYAQRIKNPVGIKDPVAIPTAPPIDENPTDENPTYQYTAKYYNNDDIFLFEKKVNLMRDARRVFANGASEGDWCQIIRNTDNVVMVEYEIDGTGVVARTISPPLVTI